MGEKVMQIFVVFEHHMGEERFVQAFSSFEKAAKHVDWLMKNHWGRKRRTWGIGEYTVD